MGWEERSYGVKVERWVPASHGSCGIIGRELRETRIQVNPHIGREEVASRGPAVCLETSRNEAKQCFTSVQFKFSRTGNSQAEALT